MTLGETLHTQALPDPGATVLVCEEEEISYGELDTRVLRANGQPWRRWLVVILAWVGIVAVVFMGLIVFSAACMNSTTEAYAALQRYEQFTLSVDRGELTPASVWHSLTGGECGHRYQPLSQDHLYSDAKSFFPHISGISQRSVGFVSGVSDISRRGNYAFGEIAGL